MDEIGHDQRSAGQQYGCIFRGVRQRIGACPERAEQRISEQEHPPADNCAGQQRDIEAERADVSHRLCFFPPEQPGDQRASALSEDIAEGHQDREQRRADGNACDQQRIACLRNEVGIRQAVDDRDDRSHHDRQRQMEICPDNVFRVQGALPLLPVLFHRFHPSRSYFSTLVVADPS